MLCLLLMMIKIIANERSHFSWFGSGFFFNTMMILASNRHVFIGNYAQVFQSHHCWQEKLSFKQVIFAVMIF